MTAVTIELDHTIVPSGDKEAAAQFFSRIFGLNYNGPESHFAPVRVNENLTLDFDEASDFEPHHYAFKVSEAEFDAIFGARCSCRPPPGRGYSRWDCDRQVPRTPE